MSERRFNSRIIHKHDTETNWLKSSFVPLQGEIVIFDPEENANINYERIKIGDGVQNVNALPFVDDALRTELIEQINTVDDKVDAVSTLVGDTSVSDQINEAILNSQADWNQNDETAEGYIKNRTHYAEEYTLTENFTFEGDNGWTDIEDAYLYADRIYNVTCDGVSYECVPYFCDWQGYLAIGNQVQSGKTGIEDNGMNFYATLYNHTLDVYIKKDPDSTHTITITSTKAKPIAPMFIEGAITNGTGAYSTVLNRMPKDHASGDYSHSEGEWTIANGFAAHAEGGWNIAGGDYSHVEGDLTVAYGDYSHAEGRITAATGSGAHSEGHGWYEDIKITGDADSRTYVVVYGQEDVHVGCTIKNQNVVAIITGYDPVTSTITVNKTLSEAVPLNETNVRIITYGIASGEASHVEGFRNIASGSASHVEGSYNVANRANTHVSGAYNIYDTEAKYGIKTTEYKTHYIAFPCKYSFEYEFDKITGCFTLIDPITTGQAPPIGSYVLSSYDTNGEETSINQMLGPGDGGTNRYHTKELRSEDAALCNGEYIHIVGNGTSEDERSNAHTLDWSGNAWFAGDVYVGGASQDGGEKLVKQSELPEAVTIDTTLAVEGQAADAKATGDAIGNLNTLVGDTSVAEQISEATYTQSEVDDMVAAVKQFCLPKIRSITLTENNWVFSANYYYQDVPVGVCTPTSKVDLQPTYSQLATWQDDGLAFTTQSKDGIVRVWAIPDAPREDITVQISVQEVLGV